MSNIMIHALAGLLAELGKKLFGGKGSTIPYPPYGKYQFTFVAKMPLDPRLVDLLDELQAQGKIAVKDMHALNPKGRARKS